MSFVAAENALPRTVAYDAVFECDVVGVDEEASIRRTRDLEVRKDIMIRADVDPIVSARDDGSLAVSKHASNRDLLVDCAVVFETNAAVVGCVAEDVHDVARLHERRHRSQTGERLARPNGVLSRRWQGAVWLQRKRR